MGTAASSPLQIDTEGLISYLAEAPIRLAVFGEFSAGKTTVLNALIGEEILSVAVEPTTAVPTRVRYGREFNIFVERTDGEQPALFEGDPPFWTRFVGRRDTLSTLQKQQGTIRDFLRTWTKEGERADEVERVVIELPLDWLKGGLELVDTPGVNNEFARHRGFTEQEAGAADLAVLLMDARQGGGKRTEFEFMNEVQRQVERCLVAPNKMDLIPEGEREEFLDYIRETALPKHWDGAVMPPVIGISALAALHPDEHGEPGLVAAFDDLRRRLERVAEEERGKLLLSRKGNPEKQLFARAKELEGEEHYGRAHRLYFDLLDVLKAAGLDLTPAEEGIARCEEHLSAQVDALDTLNERYNEAMALAEEDPDAALEELTAIRDEKEDLRLKDGDLHASIEQLRSRIEERDEARSQIRELKATVERHRQSGEWIEAGQAGQDIRPLIETAELPEETAEGLRQLVARQEQDRGEWAEKRWMKIKDEADACVEAQRYLDAEEYLDELEVVAEYTPFEEETAAFAEEVRERAELESKYRRTVREALEKADVLREDRVDPDAGAAVEENLKTAVDRYRSVYGVPDLPDRPSVEASSLPLTVNQKLGLARQLRAVAEHAPVDDGAAALVEAVETRRTEIGALPMEDRDGLDLVEEYPDHPEAEAALDELLKERLPFWALPSHIRRTRSAIEDYRDYLPEEEVERRTEELTDRLDVFKWSREDSHVAILLVLTGLFFSSLGVFTEGTAPGLLMGVATIIIGLLIQYFQPGFVKGDRADERTTQDDSGLHPPTSSQQATVPDKGYPAGTWGCPNCGNGKYKGQGFKKVPCQKCGTEMRFMGADTEIVDGDLTSGREKKQATQRHASSSDVEMSSGSDALACIHKYNDKGFCKKCGWPKHTLKRCSNRKLNSVGKNDFEKRFCKKCDSEKIHFEYKIIRSKDGYECLECGKKTTYKNDKVGSGCLSALVFLPYAGGLLWSIIA